jgi:hypothetical protein
VQVFGEIRQSHCFHVSLPLLYLFFYGLKRFVCQQESAFVSISGW